MTFENNDSSGEEHKDASKFEPFDIVLVDIFQAANNNKIHCVKKRLEKDLDLKYIAISYRWGEVEETIVPAVDYNAHITSFGLKDFFALCQAISAEADHRSMQYVWVDAICVDQANKTRRKETIYRMNDIYQHANSIIAVPDLHLEYLRADILYMAAINAMCGYEEYIYNAIIDNRDRVEELDNIWMEKELKVPQEIRWCLQKTVDEDDPKYIFSSVMTTHNARYDDKILFDRLEQPRDSELGKRSDNKSYSSSLDKTIHREGNDINLQRQQRQSQISQWRHAADVRYRRLYQIFSFLENLIRDWSNRAWVISEYHIAKRKDKHIKYWFISLNESIPSLKQDSEFRFFEINKKEDSDRLYVLFKPDEERRHPDTMGNLRLGSEFRDRLSSLVNETPFLEMLLQSKASNNSDRFNAILPLSTKYQHHIKNKDTISTWNITDMTSVRMKLRQWLTIEENLYLIYDGEPMSIRSGVLSFPSFDTESTYMVRSLRADFIEFFTSQMSLNYPNQGKPTLQIIDRNDEATENDIIQLRYSMHLYPTFYQSSKITLLPHISDIINAWTWQELSLDPTIDQFTWTRIPLFNPVEDQAFEYQSTEDSFHRWRTDYQKTLELIGCSKKNVWISIPKGFHKNMHEYVNPLDEWIWCQRNDNDPGFCVY